MKNLRRKTLAGASAAALGAGLALTGVPSPAAAVGPDTSYLVLAPQGATTGKAAARVAAADGTVVASYDQIGVLVVRSTNPAFATQVAGAGVQSVASTAAWAPPSTRARRWRWPRPTPPPTPPASRSTASSGTWT
ncbi:hypothetical protein ACIA5A_26770 [Micromonospora sp. NPDC051300]|uniref:hypothetical protein n=1 Tax=Micromonospora sp. NPDC051300 TaxID=3364286 RepID=UPI0037938B39